MLSLHIVYVSCLLTHIQLAQPAIVESSENGIETELEKIQQRLTKIGQTQQLQLEKLDTLLKMQMGKIPVSQMRVRRDEEGPTQVDLVPKQGICFTATILPGDCPDTSTEPPSTSYRDCYDAYQDGNREDGVFVILPAKWPGAPFEVLCNMTTDGGGWTVFQRRINGRNNFYRNWESYKRGFGSLEGDFWLGNERLHYLTQQDNYELRVDLVSSENSPLSQKYPASRIANESENYQLFLSNGNMGRTGMSKNNGHYFSTFDRDNDHCQKYNCAEQHKGAWWYGQSKWCNGCYSNDCGNFLKNGCCTACTDSNLNGNYEGGSGQTIIWFKNASGRYCNIKYVDMKIRPRQ